MKKITFLALCFFSIAVQAQNLQIDDTFNEGGVGMVIDQNDIETFSHRVFTSALQNDGKIILGGFFEEYNDIASRNLIRLNADGSVDESFVTGSGTNGVIYKVVVLPNQKLVAVGDFTQYNGIPANNIVRINTDGSIDNTFIPNFTPVPIADDPYNSYCISNVLLSADKLYIGGNVNINFSGGTRSMVARINENGTIDTSFSPAIQPVGYTLCLQDNGMLLVGGDGLQRFNPDGSIDTGFVTNNPLSYIVCMKTLNDKIYVGGSFRVDPSLYFFYYQWACVNYDGSLNESFPRQTSASSSTSLGSGIRDIMIFQGKVVFIGRNAPYANFFVRNPDGSIPQGYTFPGVYSFDGTIRFNTGLPLDDTSFLICGKFSNQNNTEGTRNNIMRITAPELGTDKFSKSNIFAYSSSSGINFRSDVNINSIIVYDLTGRKVSDTFTKDSDYSIKINKSNQVLLYSLELQNGEVINGKILH